MEKLIKHFILFEWCMMFDKLPEGFHNRANGVNPGSLIDKPKPWLGICKISWFLEILFDW